MSEDLSQQLFSQFGGRTGRQVGGRDVEHRFRAGGAFLVQAVSGAGVREKGLLVRVHGGAVLAQSDQYGILSTKEPLQRHTAEKAEIAERAIRLIEPNDIVAPD